MSPQTVLPVARSTGEATAMTAAHTAGGVLGGAVKGYLWNFAFGVVAAGAIAALAVPGLAMGWLAAAGVAGGVAVSVVAGTFSAAVGAITGGVKGFSNARTQLDQERAAVAVTRAQEAVATAQTHTADALQTQVAREVVMQGPSRFVAANNAQYMGPMAVNGRDLGAGNAGNVLAMRQQAALNPSVQVG